MSKRKTLKQVELALGDLILHNTLNIDAEVQFRSQLKGVIDRQADEIADIFGVLDRDMVAMNSHRDRIDKIEELQEKERVQMDDTVGCLTDHAKRVDGILKGMKKLDDRQDIDSDQIKQHGAEMSNNSRRCSNLEDQYIRLKDRSAQNYIRIEELANLTSKKTSLFKRIGAAWRAFKDPDAGN